MIRGGLHELAAPIYAQQKDQFRRLLLGVMIIYKCV